MSKLMAALAEAARVGDDGPLGSSVPNRDLEDRELRARSRILGIATRGLRRRFLATLPEIEKRGLAEQYGGIVAYGAKVGGATRDEVRNALALGRRLAPFPEVWALFETGEVGRATLMRVPVDLLAEDPGFWVHQFQTQNKRGVEALVAEYRAQRGQVGPGETVLDDHLPGQVRLPIMDAAVHHSQALRPRSATQEVAPGTLPGQGSGSSGSIRRHRVLVDLSDEEYARVKVARAERSKEQGRSVSMAEVVREMFLEAYLDSYPDQAGNLSGEERHRIRTRAQEAAKTATGDLVPRPVDREVVVRSGGTCERGKCLEPGEHRHHIIKKWSRRHALPSRIRNIPRHHPDVVVNLCSTCHGLVHDGLIENPLDPPEFWRVAPLGEIAEGDPQDLAYRKRKQEARASI